MMQNDNALHRFNKLSFHKLWTPIALSALLSACGTLLEQGDGPPDTPFDVSNIADAIPKAEPLSKYGNPNSYEIDGKRYYVLDSAAGYVKRGTASWYGKKFHGRLTSSGEPYDMYTMSAAHKTLPIPTYVKVTNLNNQRSAVVRVNDRGPFHDDRLIDLSYAAALKLGITGNGTARVEVQALEPQQANSLEQNTPSQRFSNNGEPALAQHYLQVGAFSDRGNAERMLRKIATHTSLPVYISNGDHYTDQFYRVRIGPFDNRQQVEAIETTLTNLGINNTLILKD